ncbi:MAG: cytochrome b [Paracoccaceae bacterium]
MTHPTGYSRTQIALHWAVAALVAGQYIFKDSISGAWDAVRAGREVAFDPLILAHVAGGGLVLAFVVWRLVLRLKRGVPAAPANEPAPLKTLSHLAHSAFYAVLGAMAVTGSLAWFGDLTLAADAHNVLKVVLLALVVLHVLAVPFHSLVLKNNVMRRMIRPSA